MVVGLLPLDRLPVSTYRRQCWWHGTSSDNGNAIGYGTEEEYILTSLGMMQQDMVVVSMVLDTVWNALPSKILVLILIFIFVIVLFVFV